MLYAFIMQGRTGLVQYLERQWTKTFKVSYSQDARNNGKDVVEWEWVSDTNGNPIVSRSRSQTIWV